MKKNFEIGQSNELIHAGRLFDLHNLYCFAGIVLIAPERKLKVLFDSTRENSNRFPVSLTLIGIDYFELSPGFGVQPITGLDEIGYKSPNDRDDRWLLNEQQSQPQDHLFFRFDGGEFIRAHAEFAELEEGKGISTI